MPSWNQVLDEIGRSSPLDFVRRKYLAQLSECRERNVIGYYSAWLQKPGQHGVAVGDDDKNGLMNAVHGLDRSKGLDLLLHTPGGDLAATESIVHYLRRLFGTNIEVFVPQLAMSAGTMLACAARKIYMGEQSDIGPIDPQFNGFPAQGVLEEFSQALESVKADPGSLPIWQTIIGRYHPTFLGECQKSIEFAESIVADWLASGMFQGECDAKEKAEAFVSKLGSHSDSKTHARHFSLEKVVAMGLKVERLESNQELQDLVLTVHHAYMHTLANTDTLKIIENHQGRAIVLSRRE